MPKPKRHGPLSKINDFLYDHSRLKSTVSWTYALFICTVSALIFTIGYKFFLVPRDIISTVEDGPRFFA